MTVRTTNYLVEGDTIEIKLPFPVFFSESSKCIGVSKNLRLNQTYSVSVDLDTISIKLLLPLSGRRLQGSTQRINAGDAFTI